MPSTESAIILVTIGVIAWKLLRRIEAQGQELDRVREDLITLAKQNTATLAICFEAVRRIDELEREVAAYRTIGWMRDVRKN